MRYVLIFCMLLSSCIGRDNPKVGECWYLYELAPSIGGKVIEIGEQELAYFHVYYGLGTLNKLQYDRISIFTSAFEFKRECPK